jgi:AAA family ATP:ADP antiporter
MVQFKTNKEVVLKCLSDCGYKAGEEEKDKLNQFVSDIIGMLTWNISAQITLGKNNNQILLEVIKKETNAWNSLLFKLLAIAYDAGSLAKIRANIESGTVESVNYALEMIDLVIDDSIKAKLVSLIDVVTDDEKLKNLRQFFPGEVQLYDQLIEDILNRDYNLISIWAKAYTLRNLTSIPGKNAEESVVALLFSPERILQEEAAHLIERTNKNLFYEVVKRLPVGPGSRIQKIISCEIPSAEYLFEKVKFLSGLFKYIPEDELLFLAGLMRYYSTNEFTAMSEIPDSVLWNLTGDFSDTRVYPIFDNNLAEYTHNHDISADSFVYLLPITAVEDFRNMYPENSFEILNYLDKQENKH